MCCFNRHQQSRMSFTSRNMCSPALRTPALSMVSALGGRIFSLGFCNEYPVFKNGELLHTHAPINHSIARRETIAVDSEHNPLERNPFPKERHRMCGTFQVQVGLWTCLGFTLHLQCWLSAGLAAVASRDRGLVWDPWWAGSCWVRRLVPKGQSTNLGQAGV